MAGRARFIAVTLVSATVLLSLCIGTTSPPKVGEQAPDFTLLDVDDGPHNLTDYRSRVLVVEFFATWCAYCNDQLVELRDLRGRLPRGDVAFLHIDNDDRESREKVTSYRDGHTIAWPVAYKGGSVGQDYGVEAIPTTVVIDQDGVVRYYHTGVVSASTLEDRVRDLL